MIKKDELRADVKFLAERSGGANRIHFAEKERDTGMSSNSIVGIAYEVETLERQVFPSDYGDMMSCERAWENMPEYRKKGNALLAMEAARACNYYGKK